MRHIIRGDPTPLERLAAEAALSAHQSRYGDYGRRKVSESYRVQVGGLIVTVEIINRKSTYVATPMTGARRLSKICGS
ncbi:DUF4060 family protein [Serratia fonticola]|uniref:DUF4060 family protein n=1 Tax=Serratia fonticola TaxID=47917 RepID=UPI001AE91FBA|nr:DUF4060 family protein [Serratia fonticola]MBP1015803.1 DUF4060 family protein [Serratia fonticola]